MFAALNLYYWSTKLKAIRLVVHEVLKVGDHWSKPNRFFDTDSIFPFLGTHLSSVTLLKHFLKFINNTKQLKQYHFF